MQIINTVHKYEIGERIELPEDFPPIPEGDRDAVFGYKLDEKDGSKSWVYATEEDYRAVHKLLGTSPEVVDTHVQMRSTRMGTCGFTGHNSCAGSCPEHFPPCHGVKSPVEPYNVVFCQC